MVIHRVTRLKAMRSHWRKKGQNRLQDGAPRNVTLLRSRRVETSMMEEKEQLVQWEKARGMCSPGNQEKS